MSKDVQIFRVPPCKSVKNGFCQRTKLQLSRRDSPPTTLPGRRTRTRAGGRSSRWWCSGWGHRAHWESVPPRRPPPWGCCRRPRWGRESTRGSWSRPPGCSSPGRDGCSRPRPPDRTSWTSRPGRRQSSRTGSPVRSGSEIHLVEVRSCEVRYDITYKSGNKLSSGSCGGRLTWNTWRTSPGRPPSPPRPRTGPLPLPSPGSSRRSQTGPSDPPQEQPIFCTACRISRPVMTVPSCWSESEAWPGVPWWRWPTGRMSCLGHRLRRVPPGQQYTWDEAGTPQVCRYCRGSYTDVPSKTISASFDFSGPKTFTNQT